MTDTHFKNDLGSTRDKEALDDGFKMIEEQSSMPTSSIHTSIDSVEQENFKFLTIDHLKHMAEIKSLGHYCQINQDGWIEQKKLLD